MFSVAFQFEVTNVCDVCELAVEISILGFDYTHGNHPSEDYLGLGPGPGTHGKPNHL
jgi:hypothetical protein